VNQAKINSRFHHLIQKHQINTPPCTYSIGFLIICPNHTYGNISFCSGYTDDCNTVAVDMHIKKSNNNDNCHTDNYNGKLRINDTASGIYNYNINASVTICIDEFNGTATMCDKNCSDASFDGNFAPINGNTICHPIGVEGVLCW